MPGADDEQPETSVAGNQIGRGRRNAADKVTGGLDLDAVIGIGNSGRPGGIGANEIPDNRIPCTAPLPIPIPVANPLIARPSIVDPLALDPEMYNPSPLTVNSAPLRTMSIFALSEVVEVLGLLSGWE